MTHRSQLYRSKDLRDGMTHKPTRGLELGPFKVCRILRTLSGSDRIDRVMWQRRRVFQWHVDETYVRIGERWCYLWRVVGQLIDIRLAARREAKAARAFMRQAREIVRLNHPLTIVTNKAHS